MADDATIAARLRRILQATQWFEEPQVRVREGVVFLDGRTSREQYVEWAGALAHNTQGVVAVVNRIALTERSIWSLAPALEELHGLVAKTVQALPFVGFGLLVLGLSWMVAKLAHHVTRRLVHRRLSNALLRDVTARAIGVLVFLVGLYIVLRVSGPTRLALTVVGGTGIAGLVLGIAFRDIMENFLASILISMQHPFRAGDLVEVAGYVGLVQRVTTRGTVLMNVEGNHIQIPNATVYKSVIRNYTANPNRREDFTVGIGYEDAIATAQEVAMQVLTRHPAVLPEPEPLVLVESLGAATVNLRLLFWVDGSQHDWRKVKSSLIRLVKRALQQAGISMPDEAREVIFPHGVSVHMVNSQRTEGRAPEQYRHGPPACAAEPDSVSTMAEGALRNEDKQLQEQARRARSPEEGEDLLRAASTDAGS